MEATNDNTIGQGNSSGNIPLSSGISGQGFQQQQQYSYTGLSNNDDLNPHHQPASYYETVDASGVKSSPGVHHGGVPTIPEGSAVRSTNSMVKGRSSSDIDSKPVSPPTTGTTTTPTSLGNSLSGDGSAPGGMSIPGKTPEYTLDQQQSQIAPSPAGLVVPEGESWPGYGVDQGDADSQSQQQGQPRYNPANYPAALKLLVSNNVAGSIIGRAGQTISELQSQSNTRIKLSQAGEYYPGTQDRVCLVQGEIGPVKTALRLLLERLYMLQEHQHSQHMAWQLQRQKGATAPTFDFVVRLLVPISSCGMIIGKSGSNIKFMEESTGVSSVRLSPKEAEQVGGAGFAHIQPPTSERVVTVTGPGMESCVQCMHLILDGMTSHPETCRYSNMTTSYSGIVAPTAAPQQLPPPDIYGPAPPSSRGPQVLMPIPPPATQRHPSPEHLWEGLAPSGAPFVPPTVVQAPAMHQQHQQQQQPAGLPRRIASSPDLPGVMLNQRGGHILHGSEPQTPDRMSSGVGGGYTPASIPSSSYSPLNVPQSGGSGVPLYLLHPHNMDQGPLGGDGSLNDLRHSAVPHSFSAPNLLAIQLEHSLQISPSNPPHPGTEFPNALVPQAPTMIAPGCFSAQVLVPDSMIGSILGRGGRTLNELQMVSGTRIRISQRGEYMPGTRSRIVTVRGPTAQAVWQAQFMMSQRMVLPPTATYFPGPNVTQQHQQQLMTGQSPGGIMDGSSSGRKNSGDDTSAS